VTPSGNLTLLQSSSPTSTIGDAVTFTATVTAYNGTPDGTVHFQDLTTGAELGTADLQVVNGLAQATETTSDLAIGTHTIQAIYAGTTTFTSTTGLLTQTVQPSVLPTTTTLSSSANPSVYGQTVTFTAVVSSSSGTPTGTVTFYEGSTTLGTAMLAVVDG